MGNWPTNCCDDLGLPISARSSTIPEPVQARTAPDVCIRAIGETTLRPLRLEKLSDKQITWQVAAVEWPKQAGISETLSIADNDIDFAVLGGLGRRYGNRSFERLLVVAEALSDKTKTWHSSQPWNRPGDRVPPSMVPKPNHGTPQRHLGRSFAGPSINQGELKFGPWGPDECNFQ